MSAAASALYRLRQLQLQSDFQLSSAKLALSQIARGSPEYALKGLAVEQATLLLENVTAALQELEQVRNGAHTASAESSSGDGTRSDRSGDSASTPSSVSSSAARKQQPLSQSERVTPSSARASSLGEHRPPPVFIDPRSNGQQPRQAAGQCAAGGAAGSQRQPVAPQAAQRKAAGSAAPSAGDGRTSTDTTAVSEFDALAHRRKRKYRGQQTTTKGSRVHISASERSRWLFDGHARGDMHKAVAHQLLIPAFYAAELDAEASSDSVSMRAVPHEHEDKHEDVVEHFTRALQVRAAEVATANKALSQRRRKDRPAEAGASSSSDDSDEAKASTTATSTAALSNDWAKDWDNVNGRPAVAPLDGHASTDPRRLMTDELYVLLVRVLLDPKAQLATLEAHRPDLYPMIVRCLLHRHRYTLFWGRVEVQPVGAGSGSGGPRYSRLVPMLYSVGGACVEDKPKIESCRRVVPLSQVGVLLNRRHCVGGHMKDLYSDLQGEYSCVPRKAVQLFAQKCHGCQKGSKKKRNKAAPQHIPVEEVRQRYVLDLVDMEGLQQTSTGDGRTLRYIAQMIDHNSKKRWTEAIAKKTGALVRVFVQRVFAEFGHPGLLHTDNGTEFANSMLEGLCRSWGTYMVHGRPYHPQSQGAVENPNGRLQDVMTGIRHENPGMTDWVEVMQQATQVLNAKRHATTLMVPDRHFAQYNKASRHKKPVPPGDAVVITVAQVAHIESLRWVRPLGPEIGENEDDPAVGTPASEQKARAADVPLSAENGRAVGVETDSDESDRHPDTSPPPAGIDEAAVDAAPSSSNDEQAASEPHSATRSPPAARSSQNSRPARRKRRVASPARVDEEKSATVSLHVHAAGSLRAFSDRQLWDRRLSSAPLDMLEIEGNIAGNDCGPASAYSCVTDELATERDAQQMRALVAAYGRSTEGRRYYERCQTRTEDQPPGELQLVVDECQDAGVTVSHDWWTLFGGREDLKVFIFSKLTNCLARDGAQTTVGLRLVTYGGTLKAADEANTVAIYFESVKRPVNPPAVGTYEVGHFELIRTSARPSTRRWRYDDPVVTDCLLPAMASQGIAIDREMMVAKMLRGARARVNRSNEKIIAGDCVWLTVQAQIQQAVERRVRLYDQKQHCEPKMLCKVAHVKNVLGRSTGDEHTTFVLMSIGGIISTNFTIDELQRTYPPPRGHPVTDMPLPTAAQLAAPRGEGKGERIKLSEAYSRYVKWTSARDAADAKNRAKARGAVAQPESDLAATLLRISQATSALQESNAGIVDEDDLQAPLPCVFCKRTLTFEQRSGCCNSECLAPFCPDSTECSGKRWNVSGLPFCSQRCAAVDAAKGCSQPLPSRTREAAAGGLSATQGDGRRHEQRRPPQATLLCCSCLAVLRPTAGQPWCEQCQQYLCKFPRNSRTGCTRAGWTHGGSTRADGLYTCVECLYSKEQDWVTFSKGSAQKAAALAAERTAAAKQAAMMISSSDGDDSESGRL